MSLSKIYDWLKKETGPKMLIEALKLIDVTEAPGNVNNPVILAWAKEIGADIANIYKADEIPWCGLFIAVVAKRSGKEIVKDPLWALNWSSFGNFTDVPMLGDVMVFIRKTKDGRKAGHVALYVGEDKICYHVLGGNQSDKVCITRINKSRLYAARRPDYHNQPKNVRLVKLSATGAISEDEG